MKNIELKNGDVIVFTCYGDRIAIFNDIKKDDISGQLRLSTYVEFVDMSLIFFEKDEPGYFYLLENVQFRLATEDEKHALYKAIGKYFTENYDKDWYNHFTDSSYFDIQDFLLDMFCIKIEEYDDDLIYPDFINEIHNYIWDKLCEAMGVPNKVESEPEMVNKQEFIEKAVEWVKNRDNVEKYLHYRTSLTDNFADALRKYLEERVKGGFINKEYLEQ
jgi:hypothetical protein